jgi:hypothetical protein
VRAAPILLAQPPSSSSSCCSDLSPVVWPRPLRRGGAAMARRAGALLLLACAALLAGRASAVQFIIKPDQARAVRAVACARAPQLAGSAGGARLVEAGLALARTSSPSLPRNRSAQLLLVRVRAVR